MTFVVSDNCVKYANERDEPARRQGVRRRRQQVATAFLARPPSEATETVPSRLSAAGTAAGRIRMVHSVCQYIRQ